MFDPKEPADIIKWNKVNEEDIFVQLKNRFKRAWKAFWAKPVCYTGVYVEEPQRMKQFLHECYSLTLDNTEDNNA